MVGFLYIIFIYSICAYVHLTYMCHSVFNQNSKSCPQEMPQEMPYKLYSIQPHHEYIQEYIEENRHMKLFKLIQLKNQKYSKCILLRIRCLCIRFFVVFIFTPFRFSITQPVRFFICIPCFLITVG